MHVANLALNCSAMRKGPCNRWTRLVLLIGFNLLEAWYYVMWPSESTSYAAHLGGWAAGVIGGVVLLHGVRPTATTTACRRIAVILFVGCFIFALGWHAGTFPPDFFTAHVSVHSDDKMPCCWHAWRCVSLRRSHRPHHRLAALHRRDAPVSPLSLVCSCALRHDDFEREDFARFSCVSVMMHGAETHQLANVQRTEWYETCHEYRAHLNATERAEEAVHPL